MAGTPLTDAINALTTYSNTVTGASDTTLSEAVATLAAGYGGGGSSDVDYLLDLLACTIDPVDDSLITEFGDNVLYQNKNATSMRFRELTRVRGQNFRGCNNLKYAVFDKLTETTSDMISYCSKLERLEFGTATTKLAIYTVENDTILDEIILRSPSVVQLAHTRCFDNTPYKNGGTGGVIYVPQALISSYQSANNWSTVHGWGTITWTAIEGSYYETHHADGSAV